jgi:hypothetical protein
MRCAPTGPSRGGDDDETAGRKFAISCPFLNPREVFEIIVFFEGAAGECKVRCRLSDVKIRFKSGEYLPLRDALKTAFGSHLKVTLALVVLAIVMIAGIVTPINGIFDLIRELVPGLAGSPK